MSGAGFANVAPVVKNFQSDRFKVFLRQIGLVEFDIFNRNVRFVALATGKKQNRAFHVEDDIGCLVHTFFPFFVDSFHLVPRLHVGVEITVLRWRLDFCRPVLVLLGLPLRAPLFVFRQLLGRHAREGGDFGLRIKFVIHRGQSLSERLKTV